VGGTRWFNLAWNKEEDGQVVLYLNQDAIGDFSF